MRFRTELSIQCYDPSKLFDAGVAAAQHLDISREMYLRARASSPDAVQFDAKALLTLATLLPGCDVTVERIGRGDAKTENDSLAALRRAATPRSASNAG